MVEYEDLDYFDSNVEISPGVKSNPDKKSVVCFNCNYKFSLNTSNFFSIVCPWCGKNQDKKRR